MKLNVNRLSKYMKGFANHYRIKIVVEIAKSPGLSLGEIVDKVGGNYKTISVHARYLAYSGVIIKKYRGRKIAHYLTEAGKDILTFLGKLDRKI